MYVTHYTYIILSITLDGPVLMEAGSVSTPHRIIFTVQCKHTGVVMFDTEYYFVYCGLFVQVLHQQKIICCMWYLISKYTDTCRTSRCIVMEEPAIDKSINDLSLPQFAQC